jgi:hypothetical protein
MLRNLAVASYVCIALGLLLGHEHKTTAALVFFTCAILISAGLLVNRKRTTCLARWERPSGLPSSTFGSTYAATMETLFYGAIGVIVLVY